MNEERRSELEQFMLSPEVTLEECRGLEMQELIYLVHVAKQFRVNETARQHEFDEKKNLAFTALKDKVKEAEDLYLAVDTITHYPYVDTNDRIWMFSKESYALHAQDYFMQQFISLELKKITRDDFERAFGQLHVWGFRNILLDNGQFHIELDRDDIVPPSDWGDTPDINIPVMNPNLQHALIRFFQTLYSKSQYEGKKQHLQNLEEQMLDELTQAKYLIPMQWIEENPSPPDERGMRVVQEGARIQFATLVAEDQTTWLPVFTDWLEFEKAYDKNVWGGNIAFYPDILALSAKMDGVVINCRGMAFRMDEKNKAIIDACQREKRNSKCGQPSSDLTAFRRTQAISWQILKRSRRV